MKKPKIVAVVLASLACAILLGSCDYWKEEWYKDGDNGSGTVGMESGGSGGNTSEICYKAHWSNPAAFENEFGAGTKLYFGCNGNLFDGNPHQGRARAYNLDQGTVLKDGTFQGTWKDQFTFTLDGTTYVGRFWLPSGESADWHLNWNMDIYDSSGTTLLCTAECLSTGENLTIWDQPEWQ